MERESISFVNQLLEKLEANVAKLEKAKKDNDPRAFNEIKKNSFDIHAEIEKLIK
jgi:hypothetical protein